MHIFFPIFKQKLLNTIFSRDIKNVQKSNLSSIFSTVKMSGS